MHQRHLNNTKVGNVIVDRSAVTPHNLSEIQKAIEIQWNIPSLPTVVAVHKTALDNLPAAQNILPKHLETFILQCGMDHPMAVLEVVLDESALAEWPDSRHGRRSQLERVTSLRSSCCQRTPAVSAAPPC